MARVVSLAASQTQPTPRNVRHWRLPVFSTGDCMFVDDADIQESKLERRLRNLLRRFLNLYRPSTLMTKGLLWSAGVTLATAVAVLAALGFYWDTEPALFDVRQIALERVQNDASKLVVGYVTASTVAHIAETLLYKRGGYLSNDIAPPGVLMDNIPNWEFGALVILRDMAASFRNHFSRSQSQSVEDRDLARAEPQFNFQNDSWLFPATESEYKRGLAYFQSYLDRLTNTAHFDTQFYARADNLRDWLMVVEKRLGSLSQRLSASTGQVRLNTDLAGDTAARQSTHTADTVIVRTPWLEIDDVFYEARGTTWALLHLLKAVEIDFKEVLQDKNALISVRQIIRELEAAQQSVMGPVILNGSGFGLFANYSITMANYISRANAAIIDLRDLLARG